MNLRRPEPKELDRDIGLAETGPRILQIMCYNLILCVFHLYFYLYLYVALFISLFIPTFNK